MDVLVARSLHKTIKEKKLLDNVHFRLKKSECVGIVGSNGVGKTVLLFILLGLITPDSGKVTYWGQEDLDIATKKRMNIVFANSRLFEELSPFENIKFYANLYGLSLTEVEIEQLFITFHLDKYIKDKKTKMNKLSSGENAKVHLIKAFINSPELVFLDEPTAHLDTVSKKEFYESFLDAKRKNHFSCVLISHSAEEVRNLCDRVLCLNQGKLKKV